MSETLNSQSFEGAADEIESTSFVDSTLDIVALRKKVELLRKREALRKSFGLLFYKPHTKQEAFHAAGDFKFRLLEAGNRFGKSDCGAAEDCAFALGERPWLDKDDPVRYLGIPKKPNKILVICADWDKVDEIFTGEGKKGSIGKLWRFLPEGKAKAVSRNSNGAVDKIMVESVWGGNSTIFFDTRKSFAQNPMGSESSDWDYVHIDEPITESHWKAVSRGFMDRDGKASFTCTNLDQPWISDFFRSSPRRKNDLVTHVTSDGYKSRWILRGTVYDNPYLSKQAIAEFEATLTDDEKQCRLLGIPLHLSGLVYKEFQREKHVLTDPPVGWLNWNTPPLDWSIYVACDIHPRTPNATLLAAVSPMDYIYFYRERYVAETAQELASALLDMLRGRNVVNYQLDPLAYVPDPSTKRVFANCLHQNGLPFQKAIKDLVGGIKNAQQYLKFNRCFFAPTLERTLWEMEHYTWQMQSGAPTNKPNDVDDHMMECMYRILMKQPQYSPPETVLNFTPEAQEITSRTAMPMDSYDDLSYLHDALRL